MKKLLAFAILGLMSAPASAADLGGQGSMKDSFDAIPGPSAGGFYIDFGVGGSFNKSSKDVSTTTTIPYYDVRTYSGSTTVYDTGVLPNGTTPDSSNIPTSGYIGTDGVYYGTGATPDGATSCTTAKPCYVPGNGFQSAPVTITNTQVTTGYIVNGGNGTGDNAPGYHATGNPTVTPKATCTAAAPCYDYKANVSYKGVTTAEGYVSKTSVSKATYGYSGMLAETRLGYDFKIGSAGWFFGPIAGINYDWSSDNGFQNGFGYKAGARLGYQIGNARLFTETGYAGSHVSGTGFSSDANGWFVGGGAEVAVAAHTYIFARADWEKDGSFTADDGFSVDNSKITALAGLGFRW